MEMTEDEISAQVVSSALKIHSALGPGLLESVYEACIAHELVKMGLKVERQVELPVLYDGLRLNVGFRLDIVVNKLVVIEIKASDGLLPIHTAQVLTYLKLGGYRLGMLLNFNVVHMRGGIKRVVNNL